MVFCNDGLVQRLLFYEPDSNYAPERMFIMSSSGDLLSYLNKNEGLSSEIEAIVEERDNKRIISGIGYSYGITPFYITKILHHYIENQSYHVYNEKFEDKSFMDTVFEPFQKADIHDYPIFIPNQDPEERMQIFSYLEREDLDELFLKYNGARHIMNNSVMWLRDYAHSQEDIINFNKAKELVSAIEGFIFNSNMRLLYHAVNKFDRSHDLNDIEEAESIAMMSMLNSIKRYDVEGSAGFPYYAITAIYRDLYSMLRNRLNTNEFIETIESPKSSLDTLPLNDAIIRNINQALSNLPDKEFRVIRTEFAASNSHVQNKNGTQHRISGVEKSSMANVKPATYKITLDKAKRRLRNELILTPGITELN
jgi:RNA polymerase sigma factor (sigma-70 family)